MTFDEILERVIALLQREGRVAYRVLKRRFDIDDEYIEDLKADLIDAKQVAVDEDGKVLVWVGASPIQRSTFPISGSQRQSYGPQTSDPGQWTPPHLAERIRAEQVALEARGATDGERKTITALFADLKGSTALIEGLDPEEARAIIDPALQLMMDAVHRYEGYVAQALGDGIFALFGAPIAHEDHPQRALYAALRMQDEMRHYADQVRLKHGAPLSMRVGLNTGEVVVRSIRKDDLHTDYVPVGHSINLAARMEQMATPGSILITEQTQKLTEGYFELKALGAAEIKGVEAPLQVYEVLGAGPLRTKLQVAVRRGLTRFVGRQGEMGQLHYALAQAKAGHGQLVGVMGEPGLGKSRLFYEFKLTAQSGCLALEAYSASHGKASPYLPVIELLKAYFAITLEDDERTRREKIGGKVLMLDRSLEDTLPYLFALLGIDDPTSSLQQMDVQIRRRRTFEALKKLFLRESLNQPLVLIFEDLHWIDSETQGFLDTLSESIASARILLLTNYRPEYRHEWGSKTYYTQLRLAPLGREEAQELLTFLLGNNAALRSLKQLILEKTQGTPFFMEEVVQTLAEEQVLTGEKGNYRLARAPTELHISPTVQGVLAARIDRLAVAEKEFLQQVAVMGREFSLSLLRQVVIQPEEELYRWLASLQNKEFLYEQPAFPEVEYIFKHALTQEVAYGSLLTERRSQLHERTAQAIEALYPSRLEDHYSDLAHHYSRSGNTQKAVEYLHLAGQQAVQRSANAEAINHLTTALELLKALPETTERAAQELLLYLLLGPVLFAAKGYGSPEVERVYGRARALSQQAGDPFQQFQVLWGLWIFALLRSHFGTARELGQQLVALAEHAEDQALLLEASGAMGVTLFWLGELELARDYLEQGLRLYSPQSHQAHAVLYGQHPAVLCASYAAWALWHLGYPEQALEKARRTFAFAQESSHPFSMGMALNHIAWLHHYRREEKEAGDRAEAAIRLSEEQGFPYWLAEGTIFRGWALVGRGQREEGIAQIEHGLAVYQTTGSSLGWASWLELLAGVYGQAEQAEKGLSALAEALTYGQTTGEQCYEAELHRLKGQLTLQKFQVPSSTFQVENRRVGIAHHDVTVAEAETAGGAHPTREEDAEACFHKAIEVARRQEAKSWELRAVMSLARLWQQQGKKEEARQLLAEIYGWFTEGFDTKDLQEAKALLAELVEGQ